MGWGLGIVSGTELTAAGVADFFLLRLEMGAMTMLLANVAGLGGGFGL